MTYPIYHAFDAATGEFRGSGEADPSPLEDGVFLFPANTTEIAPPAAEAGKAIVWQDDAWNFVPDHRGETWFDGAQLVVITALGDPSEDGLSRIAPEPEPSFAPLSPRRFWLAALSLGITEDMVDAEIEKLPQPQREGAKIEKRHAQTYERHHFLVEQLPAQFDVTEAALDAAWLNAPE